MPFNESLTRWVWTDDLDTGCPPDVEIIHTPFQPYFSWPYFADDVQNCWWYAECVLFRAPEARKQQWSATALVMGVLPITLFIVVRWPRKSFVHVHTRLPLVAEIFVRAMGLDVFECGNVAKEKNEETSGLARFAAGVGFGARCLVFAVSVAILLVAYAMLALIEVYSKRAALGCPYPVFVLTWYLVALIPGAIHTIILRLQRRGGCKTGSSRLRASPLPIATYEELETLHEDARDWWLIQFAWTAYFIAGTLVYTSIMVVTVPELVAWVVASCLAVFASKACGFLLIAVLEGLRQGV